MRVILRWFQSFQLTRLCWHDACLLSRLAHFVTLRHDALSAYLGLRYRPTAVRLAFVVAGWSGWRCDAVLGCTWACRSWSTILNAFSWQATKVSVHLCCIFLLLITQQNYRAIAIASSQFLCKMLLSLHTVAQSVLKVSLSRIDIAWRRVCCHDGSTCERCIATRQWFAERRHSEHRSRRR